MGEAKQRAKGASQERLIEASEQERAALGTFLNQFAPDNRHDRQLCEGLHEDLQIDPARKDLFAVLKDKIEAAIADVCSADLVEYPTTNQVIDYFLKIVDTKIPRNLGRHIFTLEQRALRLKEGTYRAPSESVAYEPPTIAEG